MAHHRMLSVCIFCFICATHSPCSSHASVHHESHHIMQDHLYDSKDPPPLHNIKNSSREKLKPPLNDHNSNSNRNNIELEPVKKSHKLYKRNTGNNSGTDRLNKTHENYLKNIFDMFGDGNTMTMDGFEKFIGRLDLLKILSMKLGHLQNEERTLTIEDNFTNGTKNTKSCLDRKSIYYELTNEESTNSKTEINSSMLQQACPAILYSLMVGHCNEEPHLHVEEVNGNETESVPLTSVWLYSILAVFLISACGVLSLVIIPVMQKKFYKPLLQFLVALAVGTLAGDALLHLLPHAMSGSHSHDDHNDSHDENMWKGFVAMLGVTFFFFMERIILLAGKWRKERHKKTGSHSHVKVVRHGIDDLNETSGTQCMDRYNPYPYDYKDISHFLQSDKTGSTILNEYGSNSDVTSIKKSKSNEKIEDNQNMTACPPENNISSCTEINKMLPEGHSKNSQENITIILRKHGTNHHGHSHSHGHVHAAPQNLSSVAWMVIMGDGLHNFTDGMAIGAAFSGSLAGGFSTAVAVFCHELPHELGDFAMLLKAGMTIRQALLYNVLSSVLCILGNIVGIWLGNTEGSSSWVFAAAAGIFIYIALVDMIPELSSAHEDESNLTQCFLHLSGLLTGFGIMTVIALYEPDLKSIFKEPV